MHQISDKCCNIQLVAKVYELKSQPSYAYDTKLEHLRYEQGECAWYLHEKRVLRISPKLQPKYVLCVVLKRLSDVTYLIGLEKGDNRVVHHDKLKRYVGQNSPKWMDRATRECIRGN